ncbi:MAG: Nif11 family protein [Symploca sp. SIO2E6]|nr:Nif11 family protein [Symploca sp. SIO2E6]
MGKEHLNKFYQAVLNDQKVRERLDATTDPQSFIEVAVELGAEMGCEFTVEELEADLTSKKKLEDEAKPWQEIRNNLVWARGRNYELWQQVRKG